MEHRIDFTAASELFSATSLSGRSRVTYLRFDTAALAIQYAIEELKTHTLRTTTLEVSEVRLRGSEIRELYDSPQYPLRRREQQPSDVIALAPTRTGEQGRNPRSRAPYAVLQLVENHQEPGG